MANKCPSVTFRGRNREPLLAVVELVIFGNAYPKRAYIVVSERELSPPPTEFLSIQFCHRAAEENSRFSRVCEDNSCTLVEILRSFIWEAAAPAL